MPTTLSELRETIKIAANTANSAINPHATQALATLYLGDAIMELAAAVTDHGTDVARAIETLHSDQPSQSLDDDE